MPKRLNVQMLQKVKGSKNNKNNKWLERQYADSALSNLTEIFDSCFSFGVNFFFITYAVLW